MSTPSPSRTVAPGRAFAGRYIVSAMLGRGRSATVYLGRDRELARDVAIKALDIDVTSDARARFSREARITASLGHAHIVQVFDVGEDDGRPFVVLEYLPGESLESRIVRDGALPPADVMQVGRQLASALRAAHAAGVLHRDVKPGNVVLRSAGGHAPRAMLVDFGLAHLHESPTLTAEGEVLGSPRYLAPERLEGADASEASDAYALGVCLLEALTGAPAFDAPNPIMLRARILAGRPAGLDTASSSLPASDGAMLEGLLARAPGIRLAALEALSSGLGDQSGTRPVPARNLQGGDAPTMVSSSEPASSDRPTLDSTEPPPAAADARRTQRLGGLDVPSATTRSPTPEVRTGALEKTAPPAPPGPAGARALGALVAGRYRLERELGRGGMGVVYEATDTTIGRTVAVKVVVGRYGIEARHFARLEREARAVASIGHPNVVLLSDFGVDEHGAYLVMERLLGESLRQRLDRDQALSEAEVVAICAQALDALAAVHARGMVHRDLKPENLFLVPIAGGRSLLKLLDFGIVKLREEDGAPRLTKTGVMIGTPAYMPPEQIDRSVDVDPRADLYALCASMYEALTGVPPFQGDNVVHVAHQVLTGRPRDPRLLRPDLGAELAELVLRGMAHEREARFGSASEMSEVLACVTPSTAVPALRAPRPRAATAPTISERPMVQGQRPAADATVAAPGSVARDTLTHGVARAFLGVALLAALLSASALVWVVARSSREGATAEADRVSDRLDRAAAEGAPQRPTAPPPSTSSSGVAEPPPGVPTPERTVAPSVAVRPVTSTPSVAEDGAQPTPQSTTRTRSSAARPQPTARAPSEVVARRPTPTEQPRRTVHTDPSGILDPFH